MLELLVSLFLCWRLLLFSVDEEGRQKFGQFVFETCWEQLLDKLCCSDYDALIVEAETELFVYLTVVFAKTGRFTWSIDFSCLIREYCFFVICKTTWWTVSTLSSLLNFIFLLSFDKSLSFYCQTMTRRYQSPLTFHGPFHALAARKLSTW